MSSRLGSFDLASSLERARVGDDEALDRLVRELYPLVLRIVRVRMSGGLRLHLESADIVQDVLIEVVQRLEGFVLTEPGRFVNWLARIVQNRIHGHADRIKAQKRDVARTCSLEAIDVGDGQGAVPASGRGPAELAASLDETELVDECIAGLPGQMREILLLRDIAGVSWPFVIEDLGLASVSCGRELHRKARQSLASAIRAARPTQ